MPNMPAQESNSADSEHSIDAVTRLAADLVLAFVANNSVSSHDLPELLRQLREELARPLDLSATIKSKGSLTTATSLPTHSEPTTLARSPVAKAAHRMNEPAPHPAAQKPAVPVEQSVSDDFIICLEDGRRYRTLKRHLAARYGLTPDEYRRKWQLPADYPMVAPDYAKQRAETARRIGLGGKPSPKRNDGEPSSAVKSRAGGRRS